MLVTATSDAWVLVTQHDHAAVAGALARRWRRGSFPASGRRDGVELAVRHHDRGWIPLDREPLWNDAADAPYSFVDYPAAPKLAFYHRGVDEVETMDPYAGLLCSLHYAAFVGDAGGEEAAAYRARESARRARLRRALELEPGAEGEDGVTAHLRILQFLDNLSLFLCLEDPGVRPVGRRLHPDGVVRSQVPIGGADVGVAARWTDEATVTVVGSPFGGSVDVEVRRRRVPRSAARERGIAAAYEAAEPGERRIRVRPEGRHPRPGGP